MGDALEYGPDGGTVSGMNEEEMRDHVEMLLHRMEDEDRHKQFTAGVALSLYIGDQSFLPDETEVHPAATLAAALLRPKQNKDICMTCVRALALMGPHAAPHASAALVKMLGSSDFELRWETTIAIRAVGPGAAEGNAGIPEALARVLREDESSTLRYETARALQVLGPGAAPGAAEVLAQAMEEEDTDVQNTSAKALRVMGPAAASPSVLAALVKAVKQGSFELKRLAAEALAAMGPAAASTAPMLARLLRPTPTSDATLRCRAAEALGRMDRQTIRQEQLWLAQALGDPDERVRDAARVTLKVGGCRRALKGATFLHDPETEDDEWGPTTPGGALAALGEEYSEEEATLAALEAARESGRLRRARRTSRGSLCSSSRSSSCGSSGSVPSSLVEP